VPHRPHHPLVVVVSPSGDGKVEEQKDRSWTQRRRRTELYTLLGE
jgi:hypothetical protein